ncbi:MAG: hypothetical protein A3C93_06085 [Candidatus Lloydbacteria bacterium RIFCSPHIGHO2_02_FULL_54_17]|uniref:Glycoside hydrolase family 42 N-terminal domain-containing protein n=1 Tax=Candidatus Lloydbacteria bacterium RIFCSPHIGHO2_02_FULL_54_17 TaxID=1798664 RepID=A0A1G2DIL4_9BACT|nr:MAG: hypothetical protein A2762_00820 [Candidatus Lloydbacteria bacterium RIFCSPHIGHO2_01_FULL_54_11]OGZ12648.1 MAG: hypothetical protein A3C93_06085 [Candidatus Lloydbacteria bacterium RIFCSPHIGHO2_02_FULL_54_17]OGZ13500.1 MAG: hypothetical protein A2948_04750 [Candidatus Lloydbacteria bacterium RIFCSPLOWO2_01_FULL_54_18]OGZ16172.1 MAG: hypothetical protein A3H76_03585 [Candidatus Lloydbacteria bacterium RIFCSPLOWO2_02_FULL_54_12]
MSVMRGRGFEFSPLPRKSKWSFIVIGIILLLASGLGFISSRQSGSAPTSLNNGVETLQTQSSSTETRYLAFQVFIGAGDPTKPVGDSATLFAPPSKAVLSSFTDSLISTIGTTGNEHQKLAFIPGPISFDYTDADIRRLISDSFAIAEEKNIAVGFHVDDSMWWAKRTDLLKNPKNIEWTDWNGTVFPHRYVDWVMVALPPQMCYNSPEIVNAVSKEARDVIGPAIAQGIAHLKSINKEHLFAGVISGWETHLIDYSYYGKTVPAVATLMDQDKAPQVRIGYCALSNLGYSAENPPANFDTALDDVVRDFALLWAKELNGAGVPKEKIYTHIAYIDEKSMPPLDVIAKGLDISNPTYSALSRHSPFSAAFNDYSRPGFSTYPDKGIFDAIYRELANHPTIGWASSEGTNVIPGQSADSSGMSMETYLARMFNHGATLVNIFSWGMGGDALKSTNPFRIVTEGPEAIAAYQKFLSGGDS